MQEDTSKSTGIRLERLHESALRASKQGEHSLALAILSEAASLWFQLTKKKDQCSNDYYSTTGSSSQQQLEKWRKILLKDQKRFTEAVYGVKNSDGRVSLWRHHLPTSRNQQKPPQVLFYAWAQHNDTIYRVGGYEFPFGRFPYKEMDLVWAFDIPTKNWKRVDIKTSGGKGNNNKSPGPRAEHGAFVYKNGLYVLGGTYMNRQHDMKLYRLDLKTFAWEVVKTRGAPPPGRCSFGLCLYRNQVYIHGGRSATSEEYYSDVWCIDVNKSKPEWRQLSPSDPDLSIATPRKSHCIFTDGIVLYVFGGLTCPRGKAESRFRKTIKSFEGFNIQEKRWQKLACIGDDPWDLAEMCALPLYEGQRDPQSVLIWGGYREGGEDVMDFTDFDENAKPNSDQREYGLPYRRRLLNFNFETKSWRLLEPTRKDLAPTAQSIAAELDGSTGDSDVTRVLIVGGYGLNSNSSTKDNSDQFNTVLQLTGQEVQLPRGLEDDHLMTPKLKQDVLEVQMQNGRAQCFADRVVSREGWEWDFYKKASSKLPQICVSLNIGSPTHHWIPFVAEDDFRAPPSHSVVDNDESTMLGRLVVFRDLKGRQDLNGKTGRCGPWVSKSQRYVVAVRDGGGTLKSVVVKSPNLVFPARALNCKDVVDDVTKRNSLASTSLVPVNVYGCWASGEGAFDPDRCPLDPSPELLGEEGIQICTDSYHGPLSAKAMAVLDFVGEPAPGPRSYVLATLQMKECETQKQKDHQAKVQYYNRFVQELRESDGRRVAAWQKALIDSNNDRTSWCQWLHIKVTLDGAGPTMERELIVASRMTLAELHHQVLTPALGWTNNFHSYAFRSKEILRLPPSNADSTERDMFPSLEEQSRLILDSLEKECWIGPSRSTALDSHFQPLYIGGALANDREIFLGDVFFPKKKDVCYLQYIHDFGAWWSHTIQIRRHTCKLPNSSAPAVLVSGKMACPPDDIQGIKQLAEKARKLAGVDGDGLDPSKAEWWELINVDWRSKKNYNYGLDPLTFEIDRHRKKLKEALLVPVPKRGREGRNMTMHNRDSGLSGCVSGPGGDKQQVKKKPTDPTKYCAVCNVTAALSLCSGCRSIAFCCREHQVQHWPQHKATCRDHSKA